MRVFYWMIMNQHASKPHGANCWNLEVSTSPCFVRGGVLMAHKYTTQKFEKYARYGAARSALYHRNQDRVQGCACHFTGQVLKALRSKQENQNSHWNCT